MNWLLASLYASENKVPALTSVFMQKILYQDRLYLKKMKAKLRSKVFREPQKNALDTRVPSYLGYSGLLFTSPFPFLLGSQAGYISESPCQSRFLHDHMEQSPPPHHHLNFKWENDMFLHFKPLRFFFPFCPSSYSPHLNQCIYLLSRLVWGPPPIV